MSLITRTARDERGGVAVIFGLAVIPIFAFAGFAMDFSRATDVRAAMQNAADSTALQAVIARQEGRHLDIEQTFMGNFHHAARLENFTVTAEWTGSNRVRIASEAVLPMTVGAVLRPTLDVGVAAIAEGVVVTRANESHFDVLDFEAHDLNELFAYCYDPVADERLGPIDPDPFAREERMDFIKVADNDWFGGFDPANTPQVNCLPHEEISYMLRNTRDANNNPSERTNPNARIYEFFSDTTRDPNDPEVLVFNFELNILETILCRTLDECRRERDGGILPDLMDRYRDPNVNELACREGYYLYIGFEDRPPEWGHSDRDYDDLSVVISCPSTQERRSTVRLVG
jgi:hypothetical protein